MCNALLFFFNNNKAYNGTSHGQAKRGNSSFPTPLRFPFIYSVCAHSGSIEDGPTQVLGPYLAFLTLEYMAPMVAHKAPLDAGVECHMECSFALVENNLVLSVLSWWVCNASECILKKVKMK